MVRLTLSTAVCNQGKATAAWTGLGLDAFAQGIVK